MFIGKTTVSAALLLANVNSIESAPWRTGTLEDTRVLTVSRSFTAPVGYGTGYGGKAKFNWKIATLHFEQDGVSVRLLRLPRNPDWQPPVVTAVEALKKVVADNPAEPGWTTESGSSSASGSWYAINAPDGRRWCLSCWDMPKGMGAFDGLIVGPLVAPRGSLQFQPARMRGDFSSGPFSRENPIRECADPGNLTPFMRWCEVVNTVADGKEIPPNWGATSAYNDVPCQSFFGARVRAAWHGRPAPSKSECISEVHSAWIREAEEILLGMGAVLVPTGKALEVESLDQIQRQHGNVRDRLTTAIERVGRIPTREEWAAAGWP